jgi:hypothetical protein
VHLWYVRMSERPLRGAAADSKEDSSSSGADDAGLARRDATGVDDDAGESAVADDVGEAGQGTGRLVWL